MFPAILILSYLGLALYLDTKGGAGPDALEARLNFYVR